MAENAAEATQEESEMIERENRETATSCLGTESAFLAELNLILLLSFYSLSGDEIDLAKSREIDNHVEARNAKSRSRREINESKFAESRSTKFQQTKIRDCRHCRRM